MTTDPLFKVVQKYPAFHNHSINKENIDAQQFRKNLKGKIDKDPTQVLKTVYDNFLSKTKKTVPCYASVKSTMQRHRAKKLPANPISFETTIKGKWAKTINGKQFLIKNDKKNGIVIFATEKSLKILGKSATILCDGTFKCCPPPYEQLYVLFGQYLQTQKHPLVFALLSGKSTFIYRKLFKNIANKREISRIPMEAKIAVTDYEKAIFSTIETDFPTWTHKGCFFQFTRSIYRKVQQMGMAKAYRKSPMLKFFFRKIMGLAFLPENEVLTCILSLLRDPQTIFLQQNPKIADFLKYFHRTWILTFDIST